MPTTPSGTRTCRSSKPLARIEPRTTSPTGSGRPATWRSPPAIPAMRLSANASSAASFASRAVVASVTAAARARRAWSITGIAAFLSQQHEVVTVDDLSFVPGAELGGELHSGATEEAGQLCRVIVHQAARHRMAVQVDQVDRVTGGEPAVHRRDSGGQQGGAAPDDRLHGTGIQVQP